MKVEIYGAEWCAFCKQAKMYSELKKYDTKYYDVETTAEDNKSYQDKMNERLGYRVTSIPQIFINGEHIEGGYEGLMKYKAA